jgi:hypothetical protein
MTPEANFATSFASVVDTAGKFATGVNDTSGKFTTGVNDSGGKLLTVSTKHAAILPLVGCNRVIDTGGKQWEQLSDC